MSFEAAENRANASAIERIANARALIGAGDFPAIFDDDYSLAAAGPMGESDSSPMVQMLTSDVPDEVVGMSITVRANEYRVTENRPDGAGMSVLLMERA